jgi:tetratricopeptide (TPR) repeat protein
VSKSRFFHLLILVAVALVLAGPPPLWASAESDKSADSSIDNRDEVCDPIADYFLGMEDYPEAIRRHVIVINRDPDNALAHYHLGFAYGMIGRHDQELRQYRDAIELGLSDWELFLNLGLLYLEGQRLDAATDVLRLATLLGPDRPETHFNLGLVYERRGMLAPAEQEILLSLRLDGDQPDALNTLGVIYAEEGQYSRAREEWTDLLRTRPTYQPAQANLTILDEAERGKVSASFGHPH